MRATWRRCCSPSTSCWIRRPATRCPRTSSLPSSISALTLTDPDPFDLHAASLAPTAAAKIDLLARQPYRSLQVQQRLLDVCIELLPSAVVQDRAVCALVQILARLTRCRPFVERFLLKGGMKRLLNLSSAEHWKAETEKREKEEKERKRAAEKAQQAGGDSALPVDDSKKAEVESTASAPSNLLFESSLATLLAHVLTPPSALQSAMQEEVVTQLTELRPAGGRAAEGRRQRCRAPSVHVREGADHPPVRLPLLHHDTERRRRLRSSGAAGLRHGEGRPGAERGRQEGGRGGQG